MGDNMNDPFYKYRIPEYRHRTQTLWQIWIPIIVILLLLAGLLTTTLFLTKPGTLDLGTVQNAAIILMILPLALLGLLAFVALITVIAATSRFMQFVPRLRLISAQLDSINATLTIWANRVMLPFVISRRIRSKLNVKNKNMIKPSELD